MDSLTRFDRRAIPDGAAFGEWIAPDGWGHRRFDWPAREAARGSILFQGGRGDIVEKYLESFDHWHRAGWSVTSFDWRGQGGSGRLAADPMVGHATDFAPWIDDLAAFWRDWTATQPAPHVAMGHSMGGHLILRGIAEGRVDPDAVVLIAPMLGLHGRPLPPLWGRRVARMMTWIGAPDRSAWKSNEIPGAGTTRQALLTHDADRYADELWWKAEKPALALGPPSWAWVAAAYESTLAMATPGAVEHVAQPILFIGSDADKLVDPAAIRAFAARLPHGVLQMYGDESAHEILREADPVREDALARIDAFLAEHAGRP